MDKTVIEKVDDWTPIAKQLLDELTDKKFKTAVLALSGDLGVGKTTFIQKLAQVLGITEPVTSPTFTIMKRYETSNKTFSTLIHMDAYRLETEEELEPLRFGELLELPNTLFCIEWAEKIKNVLPPDTIFLQLEINQEGKHTIHKVSQ